MSVRYINEENQMEFSNIDTEMNMSGYDMRSQENINHLKNIETYSNNSYENKLEFVNNNNNSYTSQYNQNYNYSYSENGYENNTYELQDCNLNSSMNINDNLYNSFEETSNINTYNIEQPYVNNFLNNDMYNENYKENVDYSNNSYSAEENKEEIYYNNQSDMYYNSAYNDFNKGIGAENSLEKNNDARQRLNLTKVTETVGEFASMKLRKKAYLIDKGVMLIPMIIIYFVFLNSAILEIINNVMFYGSPLNSIEALIGPVIGFLIMYWIISFMYYVLTPYITKGRTIGKYICNIRIVTTDVDNSAPGVDVLFKREMIEKLKASILFIGLIKSYKNKEGIAKHDRTTNTRVIFEQPLDIDKYGAYDTNVADYIEKE